jgi:hypothetical protein
MEDVAVEAVVVVVLRTLLHTLVVVIMVKPIIQVAFHVYQIPIMIRV